jgi:serine phosphatase RsbU (regulator of sigma subunit)
VRHQPGRPDPSADPVRRALHYALYDWTREMSSSKRVLTWMGLLLQGYALYVAITGSLLLPATWPRGALIDAVWLLYLAGYLVINGMLTSEFIRKTQLESDLSAARRIQQTLQPKTVDAPRGYEVETFYRPFRHVGGDYFDVIELPNGRTLFAVADVAGKGMPAALLAANVQALVRSTANVDADPAALARHINRHLSRYTPDDRFVTAVFIVLSHDSGVLTYVNAGHNAPMVSGTTAVVSLDATGMPLGLFAEADYEVRTAQIGPGGALLIFTDGLPDSIRADTPETPIAEALAGGKASTVARFTALIDDRLSTDDVTIVLLKRARS